MQDEAHRSLSALLDLAPTADEATIVETAGRCLVQLLGERASVLFLDGREVVVAYSSSGQVAAGLRLHLDNYPELQLAVRDRAVIVIRDVQRSPELAAVTRHLPRALRSVVVLPMIVGGTAIGALLMQSSTPLQHDAHRLDTAALLARLTARSIACARLYTAAPVSAIAMGGSAPMFVARDVSAPVRCGRKVLMVDDDPDAMVMMRMAFEREGTTTQIVEAADAKQAMAALSREVPDVLLLDLHLPGMDGIAFADALKSNASCRELPMLFLSAEEDLFARMRGRRRANVDFLAKPFVPDELLARVERLIEHREQRARLQGAAYRDELTGLSNLRHLRERMEVEQSRWQRYGTSVTMMMIDLDGLKRINDRYGHQAGNDALIGVGKILQDTTRDTDVAARWGGDEFVVLMPHADPEHGLALGNRFLQRLRSLSAPDGRALAASVGVASTQPEQKIALQLLLARADAAAYRAKKDGGDRVAVFDAALDGDVVR